MSRIGVVGAGYVGLTTAACFAHLGHDVICGDIDRDKIRQLNKGEVSILEERLPELVQDALEARRLQFVTSATEAVKSAEFVFLCVNTPSAPDGSADLSAIATVVQEIAPVLAPGVVVVNKSTVPVGSVDYVARLLKDAGASPEVGVAANPEFLREGAAVRDFLHPHRIVIGADDPSIAVRVSDLYRAVAAPVVVTDSASAEMVKYASNAFLATKISFINTIANLCEAVNADVKDVVLGMGYDPRVGFEFLHPGPGWGGSCFPKDTSALVHSATSVGQDVSLLRAVIDVNERQHERIVEKIAQAVSGSLDKARIAAWGLTFKAGTNDLRDSPAVAIIRSLEAQGAKVTAYDPVAGESAKAMGIHVVADPYEACADAQVLAILTEWDEFRWLDLARVRGALAAPSVVDARNVLDPASMRQHGFTYRGVGR